MSGCGLHLQTSNLSCRPCLVRSVPVPPRAGAAERTGRREEIISNLGRRVIALQAEFHEFAADDRAAVYRLAQWQSTPDGRAYQAWSRQAIRVLARLELLNNIWRDGWILATARSLGHSLDVAIVAGARRPLSRVAAIAGGALAILGLLLWRDLVVDAGAALLIWVLIARMRQASRDAAAKAERTAVFGFDPLDLRALPPWSAANSQGMPSSTLITGIRMLLCDAGRSFPAASYLPLLEIPSVAPPFLPEALHGAFDAMQEVADLA